MKTYASNQDFFTAISKLAERLDEIGPKQAANALRSGLSCLNGLTDGWAMLLESIEKILSEYRDQISVAELSELLAMRDIVKAVVYR